MRQCGSAWASVAWLLNATAGFVLHVVGVHVTVGGGGAHAQLIVGCQREEESRICYGAATHDVVGTSSEGELH